VCESGASRRLDFVENYLKSWFRKENLCELWSNRTFCDIESYVDFLKKKERSVEWVEALSPLITLARADILAPSSLCSRIFVVAVLNSPGRLFFEHFGRILIGLGDRFVHFIRHIISSSPHRFVVISHWFFIWWNCSFHLPYHLAESPYYFLVILVVLYPPSCPVEETIRPVGRFGPFFSIRIKFVGKKLTLFSVNKQQQHWHNRQHHLSRLND
jgi:hypothetical protein